jgi:hypothetical protein
MSVAHDIGKALFERFNIPPHSRSFRFELTPYNARVCIEFDVIVENETSEGIKKYIEELAAEYELVPKQPETDE